MSSVVFVHFNSLMDYNIKYIHTPHNTIEQTHGKILVGILAHQVSFSDTSDEVVDH